ncbi:MAG: NAD(P)-binding domain-containing protein [Candidatus Heimdallarchaeota archaeon]|nr:NAD(P)-binding domain-containing protein [Candidatus Heimdallarchaeota archaeon]
MYDLIIIGAGPVGLAAAIEAKRHGLHYVVVEKGVLCNSIYNFPTQMRFFTTADLLEIGDHAFPSTDLKPDRQRTLDYYRRVAQLEELVLRLNHEVLSIIKEEHFKVSGLDQNRHSFVFESKTVIIATGYFDHPVGLNAVIDNDARYSLRYKDPHQFFMKRVAIIGAGNSGAEAALELFRHGAEVFLLHRGDEPRTTIKYWVSPDLKNRLSKGDITGIMPVKVTRLAHDGIYYEQDGETKFLDVDFTLVLTGYTPNIEAYKTWGVPFDEQTLEVTLSDTMETDVKGLYVIGSAGAGRKTNKIFIENGREHAKIAVKAIATEKQTEL